MQTQPLVTIAIPTYNRADTYLPQTLQSALSQTYDNLEIVVSDNCSKDATEERVRSLGGSRVRYFRHAINIGPHGNFEFCLEQARGAYFLLLQDDNLIDEDLVEACLRAALYRTDVGLIRTGLRWIDSEGRVLTQALNHVGNLPVEDFLLGWFRNETPMHLCSTLFNTRALREVGGFHSKYGLFDDVMAEIRIVAKSPRIDVPDIKASFRRHDNTLTASVPINNWCEESKLLLDLLCSVVPESKIELIKKNGRKFLVAHNYRVASNIGPLLPRVKAHATILRQFNYPLSSFLSVAFSRHIGYAKSQIKKAVERIPGARPKIEAFRKSLWREQR